MNFKTFKYAESNQSSNVSETYTNRHAWNNWRESSPKRKKNTFCQRKAFDFIFKYLVLTFTSIGLVTDFGISLFPLKHKSFSVHERPTKVCHNTLLKNKSQYHIDIILYQIWAALEQFSQQRAPVPHVDLVEFCMRQPWKQSSPLVKDSKAYKCMP